MIFKTTKLLHAHIVSKSFLIVSIGSHVCIFMASAHSHSLISFSVWIPLIYSCYLIAYGKDFQNYIKQ